MAQSFNSINLHAPFIWHGGDYNPEQWPRETWQEDFRFMQATGVTVPTVAVFSWQRRNCLGFSIRQYMLGSDLLVAPIFSAKGDVRHYLPAGEWKNLLTGETCTGNAWHSETHDYFSLPLWSRGALSLK